MKRVFAIVMTVAVMLPSLIRIGVLIDFKLNQDLIAEMLCINREKPLSDCNGTCYLSEQLTKTELPQDGQVPVKKKDRQEIVIYCIQPSLVSNPASGYDSDDLCTDYRIDYKPSSLLSSTFRPPEYHLI